MEAELTGRSRAVDLQTLRPGVPQYPGTDPESVRLADVLWYGAHAVAATVEQQGIRTASAEVLSAIEAELGA